MRGFTRCAILFLGALFVAFGAISESDQSSAQIAPTAAPAVVTVHLLRPVASIQHMDVRDPFLPDPAVSKLIGASGSVPNAGSTLVSSAVPGTIASGGGPTVVPALGPLSVPNPDGSGPPGAGLQSVTFTLQATLIGNPSLAVFQSGTDTEILRVGEHLGDRLITRISVGEVGFADGSRLGISASAADASSAGYSPVVPPQSNTTNQTLGNPVVVSPSPMPAPLPRPAVMPPSVYQQQRGGYVPQSTYQQPGATSVRPTPQVSP